MREMGEPNESSLDISRSGISEWKHISIVKGYPLSLALKKSLNTILKQETVNYRFHNLFNFLFSKATHPAAHSH